MTWNTGAGQHFIANNPPILPNHNGIIHPQSRFVAIGDSITASNIQLTGVQMPWLVSQSYGASHAVTGQAATMGKALLCGVFGAAGKTSTDVLNTYLPQVLALSPLPSLAVILIGTNDAGNSVVTSAYAANIVSIAGQLRAAGVEPVFCTLPPNNAGQATRDRLIREYNDFLQRFCAYNGMQLLDFFKMLVDPANGQYRAGYNSDATHPNQQGYWVMGTAFRALTLPNLIPYVTGDQGDAHNMIPNGTFPGAGPLGTSLAVYSAGAGFTDSVISGDPGIVGQWQQTLGAAGATQHIVYFHITTGFSVGDTLAFACLMQQLNTGNSGTTRYASVTINFNGNGGNVVPIQALSGDFGPFFVGMEFIVPTGTTSIDVLFTTNGQMTARWAQATLVNLTTDATALITEVAN